MPGDTADRLAARGFLDGGGEMGALMRAHDWTQSPLGAPEGWPDALKLSISICLGSRFPIVLWWGPDRVMLYNDAWRPVLGETKHPGGLGRPGVETWPEIWDIVGEQMRGVLEHGEASWSEDQLLVVDRYGYREEAYFTYSYSPIRQADGTVGGIFTAVSETTGRVVGERRLRILRELAERTADAKSVEIACANFAAVLGGGNPDLPFALLYLADEDSGAVRLLAATGLDPARVQASNAIIPESAAPLDHDPWRVAEVARSGRPILLDDLRSRFGDLPGGVWPEPTRSALVLPVVRPGQSATAAGVLVAGLNPRRPLADAYRGFLELVASHMATAVANARAYQQERQRAESLAEIDRVKTAFFANVSHEFRTPLTLLLAPIEDALGDPEIRDPQRERLEIAHRNALRLHKLVNSLLDFSRIEAGRMRASYEPLDLAATTVELASMFRSTIERAGLTLSVDCPPLGQLVHVDRDMWEKIVLNLLSNAFKFTFEGTIAVSLRSRAGMAELTVRDSGHGIPAPELPQLFDRFHRVEGAPGRTHEGAGIGLALVQELARLHGGSVRVESTPGAGSTFVVAIPLGTAHIPPDQMRPARDTAAQAAPSRPFVEEALRWLPDQDGPPEGTGRAGSTAATILVADDNADMRDYLRRLLGQHYAVHVAEDGLAALDAIREQRPDLVVADVMMPRLDGFGLVRTLRADPGLEALPVILLSARADEEASVEGLQAGADDYLTKPFAARELLARIASTLQLARARRQAAERERALYQTDERLRVALQNAPIILYDCDRDLRYTWIANPLGLPAEDILGRRDDELLPAADVAELVAFKQGVLDSGRPDRRVLGFAIAGEPKTFDLAAEPLLDAQGLIVGLTVAAIDITRQTQDAAELRRLNETLEARVQAEVAAREAAQTQLAQAQRMEALGELAGGIAHDFNNVLQAVSGGLNLIRRRADDADAVRHVAQMAADAAMRGAAITSRLLTFARRGELRAEKVPTGALFDGLHEMLAHTLGTGIRVQLDAASDSALWLLADRGQLETVLVNLAVNARDAMPRGGTLTFAARREAVGGRADHQACLAAGDYVRLTVSDSGTGMDAATLARAAEPFFTTKPIGKGTGLGLAMARGFAQQSGGGFAIDSTPGQGTSIMLWFPCADPDDAAAARRSGDAPATSVATPAARVLVVDDDALVRETLAGQLESQGYRVAQASDGLGALSCLDDGEAFDLLVTDFAMPGMNGLTLIREARRRQPALPVCLLTGYADATISLDPTELAAQRTLLLRKPAQGEELLSRAAVLLDRAAK